MSNLQLNSQSKPGDNLIIQNLTKDLRIFKVVPKYISSSKQGGVLGFFWGVKLGCSGPIN